MAGNRKKTAVWLVGLTAVIWLAGCSSNDYRERADKEVYETLKQKRGLVPGLVGDLSIEGVEQFALEGLPVNQESYDFLGAVGEAELVAYVLSLEKALEVAFEYSRTYKNQKEALYLEALDLTLNRHNFRPNWFGRLTGSFTRDTVEAERLSGRAENLRRFPDLLEDLGALTGGPTPLLSSSAGVLRQFGEITGLTDTHTVVLEDQSVRGSFDVGFNQMLKSGANLALGITGDFLRFVTGDPRESAATVISGSITQPLLQGAGAKVAAENLTQAERDVIYALRDFTRFRKEFAVQVASQYYSVLQARDRVRNDWQGLQNFILSAERGRAMAEEGRSSQAQLGRLEQAVLDAEAGWISSVQQYQAALDRFKITLGLSTDAPLILDDREFDALIGRGIIHPEMTAEQAVALSLVARLDLYTDRDEVDDAERRVKVAANALKPGLDLFLDAAVNNRNPNQPLEFDFDRVIVTGGVDIELPLDKKQERNAYRASLIFFERSKRDLELAEDNVKLQVRNGWRNLDEAKRNYEIRRVGVELNERRVEEQDLLAELGRADALDQVDAQNDLINSQNALTAALVSHRIAYLEFWRDIGILFIKENGQWEEVVDVGNDRTSQEDIEQTQLD